MAKVQVKQWVILLVVATWLLTTLSGCFLGYNTDYPRVGWTSRPGYHPSAPQLRGKLVETPSNKCPDELWGSWGDLRDTNSSGSGYVSEISEVFSHNIDGFGVESVTKKHIGTFGFIGNNTTTYVVDNKKRQAGGTYYRARCDLKTEKSGYRVLRITYFDKQGSPTYRKDRFTTGNGLMFIQEYRTDRLQKDGRMGVMGKVK